jgi:hypothetical protein
VVPGRGWVDPARRGLGPTPPVVEAPRGAGGRRARGVLDRGEGRLWMKVGGGPALRLGSGHVSRRCAGRAAAARGVPGLWRPRGLALLRPLPAGRTGRCRAMAPGRRPGGGPLGARPLPRRPAGRGPGRQARRPAGHPDRARPPPGHRPGHRPGWAPTWSPTSPPHRSPAHPATTPSGSPPASPPPSTSRWSASSPLPAAPTSAGPAELTARVEPTRPVELTGAVEATAWAAPAPSTVPAAWTVPTAPAPAVPITPAGQTGLP